MKTLVLVLLYVVAAVAANIIIATYGPSAAIWTAFVLIGLNITVRDNLHERWQGPELAARMLVLILTGALLSYAFAPDAGRIGIASMMAFIAAETTDAFIYQRLRFKSWSIKANASNVGAAAVDSLLFPFLAFATWLPYVVLGQFLAKGIGGFFWTLILRKFYTPNPVCAHDYVICVDPKCGCNQRYCIYCGDTL